MGKLGGTLAMLGLAAFLGALAWTGPMPEAHGYRAHFFRAVVNGMIGQFGTVGAAAVFAGLGVCCAGVIWFGPRRA